MVSICLQSTAEEIHQIKDLQTKYLKTNLSENEQLSEGFLTASYTEEFLNLMNSYYPAILAKNENQVVGYALVATKEIRGKHELLDDLIQHCDKVTYNGQQLSERPYVIVGQLCVAKPYRGQGIAQRLYKHFRHTLDDRFDCCITDIDQNNPRSLKAHLKSGFEIVGALNYGDANWNLVLWNWNL